MNGTPIRGDLWTALAFQPGFAIPLSDSKRCRCCEQEGFLC